MSKLARTLGAVAIAAAPLLAFASPAQAANGCSVDNASTSSSGNVNVTVTPTGSEPATVTHESTSLSCEYISGGGSVTWTCTIAAGRCQVFRNGTVIGACTGAANTTCSGTFTAAAGDTISLTVHGGRGSVSDAA